MKKNREPVFLERGKMQKLYKVMKLSVVLMIVGMVQLSATVHSQNEKLTVKEKNISLSDLLWKIQNQTDFVFTFNSAMVEQYSSLNVETEGDLEYVLKEILKDTDLDFQLKNGIYVINKKAPRTVTEVQPEKITITGTVKDEKGEVLPFAAIRIKGTGIGTVTDVNGEYNLQFDAQENVVLEISSLGFEGKEIVYEGQTNLNFTLSASTEGLDEVVVVGYGSTKRERIGSAISQIKAEEIEQQSIGVTSFENILGGNIKGLQISQGSGAPGSASTVRLRGITSPFSGGNNQPLYVIDGVEFNTDQVSGGAGQNPLESISPTDIKSITVLKDAGATAIYGSRGANGVIIVTTKKGQRNSQLAVSFDASLSISNPVKKWDLLDADEFKRLHQMIAVNTYNKFGGTNQAANLIYNGDGTFNDTYFDLVQRKMVDMWGAGNTDWQNEIYNTNAPVQKYNLSLSGGTEKTNYSASMYYNDVDGLMYSDNQKRYGSRLSLDTDANKWLRLGTTLNVSGAKNSSSNGASLQEVLQARPDFTIFDETGYNYVRQFNPGNLTALPVGMLLYNVLRPNPVSSALNNNATKSMSVFANGYVEVEPVKDLRFKADLNVANFTSKGNNFQPLDAKDILIGIKNYNSKNLNYSNTLSTTLNLQAYYTKQFEDHNFDLMAGISSNKIRSESESHSYQNLGDDVYMTHADTGEHLRSSEKKVDNVMNSWFSRLQYSYKGRYTLTANMRSDESSKFGPGNKRGYFPSGAVNWNIAQENFMRNQNIIDVLKLRASYGKTGLANISDFSYLRYWTTPAYAPSYMGNVTLLPENEYPNEDVKWETTKEFNIGLDFALLGNRVYGGVDFYDKYTSDAIMPTPVYPETGATIMQANRAEISNKGMEFELGGDIIRTNDFVWNLNLNIAYNRNVLESIKNNALNQFMLNDFVEGEPIGIISGLEVSHVIRDQGEIDQLNAEAQAKGFPFYQDATTGVGDYLYKDRDGDGKVDKLDRTIIGTQEPDFFGGFSTNLQYKNLSFTAGFQYSVGNKRLWRNAGPMYMDAKLFGNMGHEALYNTYTEGNENAEYPMLAYNNIHNTFFKESSNDRMVQDASYLRLKVVNLSYRLPEHITDKLHISGMTVYVGGTNLLTFTKYEGIDPEGMAMPGNQPGDTGSVTSGVQGGDAYPMARTYTMGLKVTF